MTERRGLPYNNQKKAPPAETLEWQLRALCREVDATLFFPAPCEQATAAKRVCQLCEVRTECLDYAITNDERVGVWGGMSERERRKLRGDWGRT